MNIYATNRSISTLNNMELNEKIYPEHKKTHMIIPSVLKRRRRVNIKKKFSNPHSEWVRSTQINVDMSIAFDFSSKHTGKNITAPKWQNVHLQLEFICRPMNFTVQIFQILMIYGFMQFVKTTIRYGLRRVNWFNARTQIILSYFGSGFNNLPPSHLQ